MESYQSGYLRDSQSAPHLSILNAILTADMTFGVGSVTKTYIAALTLRLAEEGILSIDDPLSMWLPDQDDIDPTISIAQILNHTCGIYNVNENPALWDSIYADPMRTWTLDEILDRFLGEPYFSPGEGWHYTNTGYKLLSRTTHGGQLKLPGYPYFFFRGICSSLIAAW